MGAYSKINKKEEVNFGDKKTGKCVKCPPHPSPPPRKASNAGSADSTQYHDRSKI